MWTRSKPSRITKMPLPVTATNRQPKGQFELEEPGARDSSRPSGTRSGFASLPSELCHRGQMSGADAQAPKGGQALVEAPGIEPGSARRPVSPRSRA